MDVLEKILEEIEKHAIEFESFGMCDDYVSVGWVKEIIRSKMDKIPKCGECSRRKWYQKGHEDGRKDNGWIPVEEQLPEEGQKVLVWYEYFRYGEYNRMFKTYGIGWQFDGHWSGDVSGTKARCIAWQQLPKAYRRHQKSFPQDAKQHIMDRFTKVR